jgi:hypothetical protein
VVGILGAHEAADQQSAVAQDRRPQQLGCEAVRGYLRQWRGVLQRLKVGRRILGSAGALAAELGAGLASEPEQPALQLEVARATVLLRDGVDLPLKLVNRDFRVWRRWFRDARNIPATAGRAR